jgi:hypothetical protein
VVGLNVAQHYRINLEQETCVLGNVRNELQRDARFTASLWLSSRLEAYRLPGQSRP